MFAAAIVVSCPGVEISIYSTCKLISQKLLRNIHKFVMLICNDNLQTQALSVIRQNMEEIVLQGPVSKQDVRIVNSYRKCIVSIVLLCLSSPSATGH